MKKLHEEIRVKLRDWLPSQRNIETKSEELSIQRKPGDVLPITEIFLLALIRN